MPNRRVRGNQEKCNQFLCVCITDLRISNEKNFHRPQSPLFYNPPQSPFYKGGQRGIKGEKKDFPLLTRNSIINDKMNDESVLKWSSHPVKKKTFISFLVIVFLSVVWLVVYLTTYSLFLTGLSVVIMLGSLSSFFLPTHYELDQEKIKVRFFLTKREREWSAFRSFYVDKNGVLLSPFAKPSRLENFRGIYVRFHQNKDQVVDFVKSRIQR
jgi:hypothetical protein